MCVVSVILSHYYDKWDTRYHALRHHDVDWRVPAEEVIEFLHLYRKAVKYDLEHDQRDCPDTPEKKELIVDLARRLGFRLDIP